MSVTTRIGIVDNDYIVTEYLKNFITRISATWTSPVSIWTSNDPSDAIQYCCFEQPKTDVLFLDMALSDLSGPQICSSIRMMNSHTTIIGMTSYNLDIYRTALQNSGAQMLIDKANIQASVSKIMEYLKNGKPILREVGFPNTTSSPSSIQTQDDHSTLTQVEQLVVEKSLGGFSCKQIARELHITVNTVYAHRRNIRNKLHARTWQEVIINYQRERAV
ncbi:hypothetical protein CPA40_01515 [Bifidobacterium callitrichos]|uniref:Response regulator transcription factor n=1 Tax=Bifidobacterium callitrichos TaxID=762209 RepID=A0A2T3GDG5_9BIFI|nr:hypothetical protein CPA40_01515 [Bifidobacterium callitrichos]